MFRIVSSFFRTLYDLISYHTRTVTTLCLFPVIVMYLWMFTKLVFTNHSFDSTLLMVIGVFLVSYVFLLFIDSVKRRSGDTDSYERPKQSKADRLRRAEWMDYFNGLNNQK